MGYLPVALPFGTGGFQSNYFLRHGEDSAEMVSQEFKVNGIRHGSFSQLFDHISVPVSAYRHSNSINNELTDWFMN